MRRQLFIELESEDRGRMAETTIKIGDRVLGYVGGSGYISTTEAEAEEIVVEVLSKLFRDHPGLEQKSRFEYDDEDEW